MVKSKPSSVNDGQPEDSIDRGRLWFVMLSDLRGRQGGSMIKYIGAFFIFFVFMFSSCGTRYYSVTVRNDSSKDVKYTYNNTTDTLAPSSSKKYQVEAYTQEPKDISVPGAVSVKMRTVYPGSEYLFEDIPSMDVEAVNSLTIGVRITAGTNIEDAAGNPFIECPASSGTPSRTRGKIFTDKPVFESTPKYEGQPDFPESSVSFSWYVSDNLMTVSIN
jgi:hypothetical protein